MPADEVQQALQDERIMQLRKELDAAMIRIRNLELKWYGVVAGLAGVLFIVAKSQGWV